jgi:O-antigen/teichoic acid export membrane protein
VAETRSAPGRVATNTIVRAAGEAVAKVGSLAFYVVLARQLGSEEYGTFVFALALTGTLMIGAGFGTDELIAREVARDRVGAGRYLSDVVGLKTLTSLALLAVAMGVVFVGGYDADARLATLLLGLGVMCEVMGKSWHAIFQAYERLGLVSAALIIQRALTALVGIVILVAGGGIVAASAVYLGGALTGLVASEVFYRRYTRSQRPRPSRTGGWVLLRRGFPIGVAGLLFVVLVKVDILLLSFLTSPHEVGLYAAALRLIEGTQFIPWSFDAAMLPWLARREPGPELARGYMLGLKLQATILLPAGLLVMCFAGPIVSLLYGAEFEDAALPLALLGPTIALYGLQTLSATLLIARDAPSVFGRVAGAVAVQNIVCNVVAIPLWGADGAAGVALSSAVLMVVLAIPQAAKRAGGLKPLRAFTAPVLAGAALVAVAVLVPLPAIPAGALALLAYAAVWAAIELSLHRDDVNSYLRALPLPGKRPHPGAVE